MEKVCGFCLIKGSQYEIIDNLLKDLLDTLLIPLDFTLLKEPISCKECVQQLHELFNFKTLCLYTEDALIPFLEKNNGEVSQLNLESVYSVNKLLRNTKTGEKPQICRLCLEISTHCLPLETAILESSVRNVFENHLPEVSLQAVESPSICEHCLKMLHSFDRFASMCTKNATNIWINSLNNKLHTIESENPLQANEEEDDDDEDDGNQVEDIDLENGAARDSTVVNLEGALKLLSKMCSYSPETKTTHCYKCTYKTEDKIDLKAHLKSHLPKGRYNEERGKFYKCPQKNCSFICMNETKIRIRHANTHGKQIHSRESSVVGLEGALKLLSKMCSYSPETKTTHCYKCTYETKDKLDLKAHLKSHLPKLRYHGIGGDRGNFYKCPQKNCLFISRNHTNIINAHSKTHGKKIHCSTCGEICESHEAYRRHIRQKHKVGDIYKCDACPFLSKSRKNYKRHSAKHNGQLLQCHSCSYETIHRDNMSKHQYIHCQKEVYYCHNCTYSTKVKPALKIHVLVHMSDSRSILYKCDKCEFSTKYSTCLQKHRKRKHSQNPVMYQCDICQDKFKYKGLLRMHIIQYHGPKDAVRKKHIKQCPNCDYESHNACHVKKHMDKVHGTAEGNELIHCNECEFESIYESSVKNHIKREHAI